MGWWVYELDEGMRFNNKGSRSNSNNRSNITTTTATATTTAATGNI